MPVVVLFFFFLSKTNKHRNENQKIPPNPSFHAPVLFLRLPCCIHLPSSNSSSSSSAFKFLPGSLALLPPYPTASPLDRLRIGALPSNSSSPPTSAGETVVAVKAPGAVSAAALVIGFVVLSPPPAPDGDSNVRRRLLLEVGLTRARSAPVAPRNTFGWRKAATLGPLLASRSSAGKSSRSSSVLMRWKP
jgi:hypothetical protein